MSDPIDQTPLLSLPYIQGAQAQKHVTHNEAIERLDLVVQLTVEATDATTPPSSAAEGQAWIVGSGATGAWASKIGDIAAWRGGGWLFVTPQTGWRAWNKTSGAIIAFDGTDWIQTGGSGGGGTVNFNNLAGVGVNASSDATNRLAVASDATLLTHDGSGHQLKINKNAATDTASLLYQTNWSGRAEMGLAGNDDFEIKVSSDGTTFTAALRVNAATGTVTMPATGTRQLLPFNYRYYMYTDRRWVVTPNTPSTLNAVQSLGTGAEPNIDWDTKGIFIPAGTTINSFILAGSLNHSEIVDLDLRLYFQHGPWNSTWDNAAATTYATLYSADDANFVGSGGMRLQTYPCNYTAPADGYFLLAARASAASPLSTTRYFEAAGTLDVTLPPSV